VDVLAEEGSVFVGRQSENGLPLTGILYAQVERDVVYAVFELK